MVAIGDHLRKLCELQTRGRARADAHGPDAVFYDRSHNLASTIARLIRLRLPRGTYPGESAHLPPRAVRWNAPDAGTTATARGRSLLFW